MLAEEVPEPVKAFLVNFKKSIKEQNKSQILFNYESNWPKYTDKYFKQHDWPSYEKISHVNSDNDVAFMCIYKELCFRHMYSIMFFKQLKLEQRFASYENYIALFDYLLEQNNPVALDLPVQWIWDIIDEFAYQYQEFCQFRSKVKDRTQEEISMLKSNSKAFDTASVLTYLYKFMNKSDITNTLERERKGLQSPDPANKFANSPLYEYFGYFSIIGQCRLHCIMGDYYSALKVLDPIDLHRKGRYTKVMSSYISMYFYVGFSYMMLRRYQDSIKTFVTVLLYISRMKQYHPRLNDQSKNDKMYALLAILLTLCPKKIDEHIANTLHTDHLSKLESMQNREADQLFDYACPKFVSPCIPDYDEEIPNTAHAPLAIQNKLFIKEVNQQEKLPVIRSYLKLYRTIDIDKLVNLLERKVDKDVLRTLLLRFIQKNHQLHWSSPMKAIEGVASSSTPIEFYIDEEMIHIIDNMVQKRYGEEFLKNCMKLEEIITDLEKKE